VKAAIEKGNDHAKDALKVRSCFQTVVASKNLSHYLGDWNTRVEHKLRRWKIVGTRRHCTDAFITNFAALGKEVAPKVAAAAWSLAWNRWCTARRFQGTAPCVLGCGCGEDSAEHYVGCSVGRKAGLKFLRIADCDYESRKISMLGARRFLNTKEQACWAILVYGIYMATNRARNSDHAVRSADCAVEEVIQFIRRAAEGHRKTLKLVGSLWAI
jgi:hypothetical protein